MQGVGFRPFIFRLAQACGVSGSVRNEDAEVVIEAQGTAGQLAAFTRALRRRSWPVQARVDQIRSFSLPVREGASGFQIISSTSRECAQMQLNITPDLALCRDCRRELLAGVGRHRLAGYALINCTNCGPRYSIVRRTPYDRAHTTMVEFTMCATCRAEYDDPGHRRFHAQPIACAACGPELRLVTSLGEVVVGDPIAEAVRLLEAGKIVALKGLGGFHLAVRARDAAAVERLRRLKRRDAKPFALMCRSRASVRGLVDLSAAGMAALASAAAPIVLAPQRGNPAVAAGGGVAPGSHRFGVMLPYTPMQTLLFYRGGRQLGPLVMTSANRSDEPLIIDNREAIERLGGGGGEGLCDALLLHDRPIQRPVDDSLVLDRPGMAVLPIRRARGMVPTPITLPEALRDAPAGICLGGELKNTIAVVAQGQVLLSQHLGDLRHPRTFTLFKQTIQDLLELVAVQPHWVAHDLHPMYLSTAQAWTLAQAWGVPLVGVQHHHAHAAALLAEHQMVGPMLAIVCDGTGYGSSLGGEGTIWGGELLLADLHGFQRLGHLRPLMLPGGDAASVDTRRSALAALAQAYGPECALMKQTAALYPDPHERGFMLEAMNRGLNTTASTGAGRYFDAVACLLGLCLRNEFEGQAGQALEAAAFGIAPLATDQMLFSLQYADGEEGGPMQIDLAPLVREVVRLRERGEATGRIAALFHDQFAAAWVAAVTQAVARTGVRTIGLSGGVFCNQRLTERIVEGLSKCAGVVVLQHRLVPPNDGGLALGQAAVAAAQSLTW